ncbi:FecR family protein [Mucilaginibacter sp. NFX135]|uniref:FecR family protein n=1 Tax=Mucilaginibacter sp. NFX135 TaxID=3402687 RepID=UPI003AFA7C27
MMDHKQRKSYLLNQYINNACTPEEFDELMLTLKASPNNDDFDEVLKHNWEKSAQSAIENNLSWTDISARIKEKTPKRFNTRVLFKYAACFALALLIGTIGFYKKTANSIQYLTAQSLPAKTKVVTLADGTQVTLNANSSLRYPEKFSNGQRIVYLKGEAYFEVVHDSKKPFIIYSGALRTQVLGTTFTVSAYNEQRPQKVTVLTGKVGVIDQSSKAHAILTPGLCAVTDQKNKTLTVSRMADPTDAIAWMDDKMMFEDATLADVAIALSNKYAVNIEIDNPRVASRHITAIFQNQTLPDILNGITRLTHAKYRVDKNIYTLF